MERMGYELLGKVKNSSKANNPEESVWVVCGFQIPNNGLKFK